MRVISPAMLVLVLFSLPLHLSSQQTTATAPRDPQAVMVLQRSVVALGGTAFNPASTGVIARGTIATAPGGISGPILWETQGSEFRYERPGPNGTILFVSGHGNPAIADSGRIRQRIGHLAMTNVPPHMVGATLVSDLLNPAIQISAVQTVTLNGSPALKVSTVDTTDDLTKVICRRNWYLDPTTTVPIQLDFVASEAKNALDTAKMTYRERYVNRIL